MRGYGLPRSKDLISPDLADIARYGLPSAASHPAGPGGDRRNSLRPASKAAARRYWARVARAANRAACRDGVSS